MIDRCASGRLRRCPPRRRSHEVVLAKRIAPRGQFRRAKVSAKDRLPRGRIDRTSLRHLEERLGLARRHHGDLRRLAFALAAGGEWARAEEELATLLTQFPSSPFLARDTFRVRLVALASAGRFDEAAKVARERPADLPLAMHEELLCDALRVHAGDVLPEGERERIELDMLDDVGPARFVDCVAPILRARLAEARRGPRVAMAAVTPPPELETGESADALPHVKKSAVRT